MVHSGATGTVPGAAGFAEETEPSAYARKRRDAFAMFTKAPPPSFAQRWSVWTAGFGGSQTTDGNAALGSNDTTSHIAAGAVVADYVFSPDTIAGFALAGGGTMKAPPSNKPREGALVGLRGLCREPRDRFDVDRRQFARFVLEIGGGLN